MVGEEGEGREGETKGGASRRGPWLLRRTGQGRAEMNSFIMDAFFNREGKKCSADGGYY